MVTPLEPAALLADSRRRLVSAVGASSSSRTGERRRNLREFWSDGRRSPAVRDCRVDGPGGPGRSHAGMRALPDPSRRIELAFRVDAFGLLFAAGASLLWIATSFYSIGYMRSLEEHAQTRYFACFALALSATMGVAFSANLFTLFLFYEALTLATYPLVAHKETPEARAGARNYVIYLLGAAKLFLLRRHHPDLQRGRNARLSPRRDPAGCGRSRRADASLCRLRAVPVWLRQERRHAPAQLAAGRHGGADAGQRAAARGGRGQDRGLRHASGLPVRFRRRRDAAARRGQTGAGSCLGDDRGRLTPGSRPGQSEGAAGLLDGEPALLHRSGSSAPHPSGIVGGIAHVTNHAVSKITLFFCAGSIYVSTHKTEISQMSGLARHMPWTMAAFAVASSSLVGIPPASGFVSKWYLALGSVERGNLWLLACCLPARC